MPYIFMLRVNKVCIREGSSLDLTWQGIAPIIVSFEGLKLPAHRGVMLFIEVLGLTAGFT